MGAATHGQACKSEDFMSRFDRMDEMRDDEIRKRDHHTQGLPEMERPLMPTDPRLEGMARELEPLVRVISSLSSNTKQDICKLLAECETTRTTGVQLLNKMGEAVKMALVVTKNMQSTQKEAQNAGALALEASRLLQEHTQKTRVLVDVWRWTYPLATAVLVSLLWGALSLWRLPDYDTITQSQGQIWQKLEALSAAQETARKEGGQKR